MRLATLRTQTGHRAVRIEGNTAVEFGPVDLGALLADPGWRDRAAAAAGPGRPFAPGDLAPPVPRPGRSSASGSTTGRTSSRWGELLTRRVSGPRAAGPRRGPVPRNAGRDRLTQRTALTILGVMDIVLIALGRALAGQRVPDPDGSHEA
jgi:hypothetical protein